MKTDLSHLADIGIHLHNHDCMVIKALRDLKAAMYMPSHPQIEFTTHSITNPRKVTCIHCWHDMTDDPETIVTIHEEYGGWARRRTR